MGSANTVKPSIHHQTLNGFSEHRQTQYSPTNPELVLEIPSNSVFINKP
jgi:hypothetical protein